MFPLHVPNEDQARSLIETQRGLPFSYPQPGSSRLETAPPGFNLDHNRIRLGTGREAFEKAKAAVRSWEMFRMPWVRLFRHDAPIEIGTTVAMAAPGLGLWTLNACRIVYTVDEADAFGFAYGTLPHHVERGEERFTVRWDRADDSVWYDILSFSRPGPLLIRLGKPLVRRLQRRFVVDSMSSMAAFVAER